MLDKNFKDIISNIKDEIIKEINESDGLVFIDVPLLYETGLDTLCDYVILVYVDKVTQINRLCIRDNIDYSYALAKIDSQMKLDDKLVNKIKKCRTQIIAHNLFNENEFKMQVSEIEPIISSILELFNNLQFQVDNINYSLSNEEIQHIKSNCINGIKGLLKPSIFGND